MPNPHALLAALLAECEPLVEGAAPASTRVLVAVVARRVPAAALRGHPPALNDAIDLYAGFVCADFRHVAHRTLRRWLLRNPPRRRNPPPA
jgi:hypothetical protein